MNREELKELAARLYEIEDPWERCDYTTDDVLEQLENDPISIIKRLVERLEEA